MAEPEQPIPESTAPVDIEVVLNGKPQRLRYDQAFVVGCTMLESGNAREAANLFGRMEEFVADRGPRAFIMHAFCEAAAMRFEKSTQPLERAFVGDDRKIAEALHSAFVSYHVGIRQEALRSMTELVNKHKKLPTLCLLLGNMLNAVGKLSLARKCWSLAIHRDRSGGAVAAAALRQLHKFADESGTAIGVHHHEASCDGPVA